MKRLALASIACLLTFNCLAAPRTTTKAHNKQSSSNGFHITFLMLQPESSNLNYAVFVHGPQPNSPQWNYQYVRPGFSPAFDVGYDYFFNGIINNISVDWHHLNSSDDNQIQANPNLPANATEFVAPPYDVGPQLFANKHASSNVKFYFDRVNVDAGHLIKIATHFYVRLFGGVDFLRLQQTVTSTFDQNAGNGLDPLFPIVPAIPNWFFTTTNQSTFNGGGTDAGVKLIYAGDSGFGIITKITGVMVIGQMRYNDQFNSNAFTRSIVGNIPITATSRGTNQQALSAPNKIQVIPGIDTKVAMTYLFHIRKSTTGTIELGYKFASYFMAISQITPGSLVQVGNNNLPSFIYGTIAINSLTTAQSNMSFNGPYIKLLFRFK